MTAFRGSSGKPSKKALAHISKFAYHIEHTIPDIFPAEKHEHRTQNEPVIRTKKGIRSMNFHFAEHCSDGVGSVDA